MSEQRFHLPMANATLPVGVVMPYWTFWEAAAGPGLRDDRLAIGRAVVARLSERGLACSDPLLLASEGEGAATAEAVGTSGIGALLVVQTMAAPAAHTLALLDRQPDVPVVVWAVYRDIGEEADASRITLEGATVGTPMLTAVLARRGRPYELVVGPLDDAEPADAVGEALRAALAATRMRTSRVALVGDPIPGYESVMVDPEELRAAIGITIVHSEPGAVAAHGARASTNEIAELSKEVATDYDIDAALPAQDLDRTLRLALGLERLSEELEADAGAINCHVDTLRRAQDPGITPCFALGRETSAGRPWTCTGDLLTSVAMLSATSLGQPALYHEVEYLDERNGEAILANSGEHDLGWLPAGQRPRLLPNAWFRTDPRCGGCAWFPMASGPASLVGFTMAADEPSGFRFVVAEGAITERRLDASPSVGGAFRFAGRDGLRASWRRWARSGVGHHSAATRGHQARAVSLLASYLGVGCTVVCEAS